MHDPRRSWARGLRMACALTGVFCMALGLVIFPGVPGGLPAARAGAVTVTGPKMYDPAANAPFTKASTVSVDQTANLGEQMVHLSWTGFTPSNTSNQSSPIYDKNITEYPVMIAECAGAAPAGMDECFGTTNSGTPGSLTADGPMNTAYAITNQDGTGQADLRILTGVDNQTLGCDRNHPCSLAIIPAQGGNALEFSPPNCDDHTWDSVLSGVGEAVGTLSYNAPDQQLSTASCAWAKRIIVPLSFAPTPTNCPVKTADFSLGGSPMAARAIDQWRTGICTGSGAVTIQYDSATNEPLAAGDFLEGSKEMALTTRPADGSSTRKYAYAPVTVSGAAIAYWIDDAVTGQPVTNLKLDQRLVAKLLTASYSGVMSCDPVATPTCDAAVTGNPTSILTDREFLALNPGVHPPSQPLIYPTVASGNSDLTYEVTRWIASSSDATAFLAGTKDPNGMRVNDTFKGATFPTDTFLSQDPNLFVSHWFSPVFPLSLVASYQAANWGPWTATDKDDNGNYPKLQPQVPGARATFAIVPAADAAAYHFPVAAILNGAGKYVAPTSASLTAAVKDMTTNSDGTTQSANMASNDPAAYPLTMVQYAMAPTSGTAKAKAAKMAAFLNLAAGKGQTPGTAPGTLPAGFVPLNASQKAKTAAVANAVLNQTGNSTTSPTPSMTSPAGTAAAAPTDTSPSASPAVAAPSPNVSPNSAPTVGLPVVAPDASSGNRPIEAAGFTRFVLPIVLIVGGLLAVSGPALLTLGRTTWGAALIDRIRHSRLIERFTV